MRSQLEANKVARSRRTPGRRQAGPGAKGNLARALARIRLFLCDVDGVVTDGSVWVGQEAEVKRFNIQDGLGMVLLRKEGIPVGWISNRPSLATTCRAQELKIDFLHQQRGSKVDAVEQILKQTGFQWNQVCYAGDDIVDLGVLKRAGVSISVANAVPEAKEIADYVTKASGGEGAVREICELILKAQGKWDRIIRAQAR